MSMFCFQCQETVKNEGCTIKGICGKTADVACLQDMLLYVVRGIGFYANEARKIDVIDEEVDRFVLEGLFTTITNVNFDAERIEKLIWKAFKVRDQMKEKFFVAYESKHGKRFEEKIPQAAIWYKENATRSDFEAKGFEVGVLSELNVDIRSLKNLVLIGLKGMAAYADHAYILGYKDEEIFSFIHRALATILTDASVDELYNLVIETGNHGVKVMALLDKANTESYGDPEVTETNWGTLPAPGILVSGHDLLDLEELLIQTEGKGINIYTHGEMLPANAYPKLKKYSHLIGNYGTSWYNQQKEFEAFAGPILMTTNCIQKPKDSYLDRIYTTGLVAWPGATHIPNRENGKPKDFSQMVEQALKIGNLEETPMKKVPIGFARTTLLSSKEAILDAVQKGLVSKFVVMSGCDGRLREREYFTKVAEQLPKDSIILTSGCAKFRYNHLDLGNIGPFPRIIDAGQCNDSYSLAVLALELAQTVGVSVNELPLAFDIGWYEQKAVIVLLSLLALGVKNIRLGPTVPAFLSPNVVDILVEKFGIKQITTPEEDIKAMFS